MEATRGEAPQAVGHRRPKRLVRQFAKPTSATHSHSPTCTLILRRGQAKGNRFADQRRDVDDPNHVVAPQHQTSFIPSFHRTAPHRATTTPADPPVSRCRRWTSNALIFPFVFSTSTFVPPHLDHSTRRPGSLVSAVPRATDSFRSDAHLITHLCAFSHGPVLITFSISIRRQRAPSSCSPPSISTPSFSD